MLWRAHCLCVCCCSTVIRDMYPPFIESYNSMTHSPPRLLTSLLKEAFVGLMYVNGKCLISVLAVPTTWQQENTKKTLNKTKPEKANCVPFHLPRSYLIPVLNSKHIASKELPWLHHWVFSLFSPSAPQQMSLVLHSVGGKMRFCCVCQQKPEQGFFAATAEPFFCCSFFLCARM